MEIDLSTIKMSGNDVKRGLCLPTSLSEALAEDIGIMVGDGSIGRYRYGTNVNYRMCVSCDAIKDYSYLSNYVRNLKKHLFNIEIPLHYTGKRKTEIRLQIYSRGLVEFYTKAIGLPLGRKDMVRVPEIIRLGNNGLKKAFLRGLMDTDGNLRFIKRKGIYYPRIKIVASSKKLIEDVVNILNEIGLMCSSSYDLYSTHSKTGRISVCHEVYLNGSEKLIRWIKSIGFGNPKNKLKIAMWHKMKK